MKKIKIEEAIGMALAHDITRIIPGKSKGRAFRKGHVVRHEDIPELIKLGKNHLYVLEISHKHLHEDDAALRIAKAICGDHIRWTDPNEGKSGIVSEKDGLLKINAEGLFRINKIGNIIISTLRDNFPCRKDQTVAATRIIPLTIEKEKIEELEAFAQAFLPVIRIMPYRKMKIGAVVTGTEIYKGLIQDEFDEFMGDKIISYGSEIAGKTIVPDDPGAIADAIRAFADMGCDLIITTGGLSVDPDDATGNGIQQTKADIIAYGAPILPGSMFLYAVLGNIPIMGLPACVYYNPITIFDLLFPRILAGDDITADEIAGMGHGGLCMNCEPCRFPVCPFGK